MEFFETFCGLQLADLDSIVEVHHSVCVLLFLAPSIFLMPKSSLIELDVYSPVGFPEISLQHGIGQLLLVFIVKIILFLNFVVHDHLFVYFLVHLTKELEDILPIDRVSFC